MDRPTIGLIPLWDEKEDSLWMRPGYMQGLEEAGAVPVILPLTGNEAVLKKAASFFDAFLFTGGSDLHPKLYGQELTGHCEDICEIRDQMEAYIFREGVLNQKKPALGICRGIQVFNVALGGNLYQDIPTELPSVIDHRPGPPYYEPAHNVRLLPESPLCKLAGKESIVVNSRHHQGINRIGKGLEVMALSDDGLVEAVYMPDHPFLWAVQWHPECALNEEISKKIFSSFVRAVEK